MLDLHMHTTWSDGMSEPAELVKAVADAGLRALAVTDHDNTESLEEVQKAGAEAGLEIIPGIEINTHWDHGEIHVLGYYIDPANDALISLSNDHRKQRHIQLKEIVHKLNRHDIPVTMDDVLSRARTDGSVGRPHIAQAIVARGGAKDINEAFKKFLNSHAHTFCKRSTRSPHEAVEAIYESGGIPVIAHPGDMPHLEDLIPDLMNYGLRGLEAYHKSHSAGMAAWHCELAERYGLIVTGGTDFHGQPKAYAHTRKRLRMPAEAIYNSLKAERDRLRQSGIRTAG